MIDFIIVRSKLAVGLLSGEYSQKPPEESPSDSKKEEGDSKPKQREQKGIRPQMFKSLIGSGHREFSSNRQQVILFQSLPSLPPIIIPSNQLYNDCKSL